MKIRELMSKSIFASKRTSAGITAYFNRDTETVCYKDKSGNVVEIGSDTAALLALTASGEAAKFKIYRALLSQTGTGAPTAVVLENTLGVVPTFGYTQVGDYTLNATAAFTGAAVIINQPGYGSGSIVKAAASASFLGDADTCYITTIDMEAANAGVNAQLVSTYIEIRVPIV